MNTTVSDLFCKIGTLEFAKRNLVETSFYWTEYNEVGLIKDKMVQLPLRKGTNLEK